MGPTNIRILFVSFLIAMILFRCSSKEEDPDSEKRARDENIQAALFDPSSSELIVLVDNSLTSYYIHHGKPAGFEFEMLNLYAQDQNLTLRIKVIHDVAHILDSLNAGKGDVAAANLTITRDRSKKVDFTEPLFRTRQILVQRLPEGYQSMTADEIDDHLITDRLDLGGKEVYVRPNSSYIQKLRNFVSETNINVIIKEASQSLVTERLIEMVAGGVINYTISDENKARIHAILYDNIDLGTPMSLSEPIAWAVKKGDSLLLNSINQWIADNKGGLKYNVIKNRYFKVSSKRTGRLKKRFEGVKEGRLSPYDKLIKN